MKIYQTRFNPFRTFEENPVKTGCSPGVDGVQRRIKDVSKTHQRRSGAFLIRE